MIYGARPSPSSGPAVGRESNVRLADVPIMIRDEIDPLPDNM
jgi:hypothetical protein